MLKCLSTNVFIYRSVYLFFFLSTCISIRSCIYFICNRLCGHLSNHPTIHLFAEFVSVTPVDVSCHHYHHHCRRHHLDKDSYLVFHHVDDELCNEADHSMVTFRSVSISLNLSTALIPSSPSTVPLQHYFYFLFYTF